MLKKEREEKFSPKTQMQGNLEKIVENKLILS